MLNRLFYLTMDIASLLSPEIPDSQETRSSQASTQSWDSADGPRPLLLSESSAISMDSNNPLPQTPRKQYALPTTRSDRIRIKTALDFNIPIEQIQAKYGYTEKQIRLAKQALTPRKQGRCGRRPKITTPKRQRLEQWLLASPSRRHIAFRHVADITPLELGLRGCGEKAIRTAFKLVGYGRRVAKRKGFSDDPVIMRERLDFASEAINWSKERLYRQIFSDEVWAHGGAHTQSYVTVKEDGSDRYSPDCLQHKYSKQPAWMFHGTIVFGGKGPAVFWEKDWGSMDSYKYDAVILNNVESFLAANPNHGFV